MTTDHPAEVRTSAAVAPPGPVPTMTASHSGVLLTTTHFGVGVAARLAVAGELDRSPARSVAIPAVLRRTVRPLARMLVEQRAELVVFAQARGLRTDVEIAEVITQRRETVAVDVLPAAHRPIELSLGDTARSLDACSPCQLFERRQFEEVCEAAFAARTTAEWAAREDAGRVDREGSEHAVDVLGDTERGASGVRRMRRQ